MKTRRRLYKHIEDGQWVRPQHEGFRLACCDCGLVHELNFRVVDGAVEVQAIREPRATRGLRKRMGVELRQAA
jgi:hypothetical protein